MIEGWCNDQLRDYNRAMRKAKSAPVTLSSISEARAQLEAQMAELNREEKRLQDEERDAGRKVLMSALGRVRIGAMTRDQAKVIAEAIARLPATELVAVIGEIGKQ